MFDSKVGSRSMAFTLDSRREMFATLARYSPFPWYASASTFPSATKPVVAFVNCKVLEDAFPVSTTWARVCSFVKRFAGSIFFKSFWSSFTYTYEGAVVFTTAFGMSFDLPTPVTNTTPFVAWDVMQMPTFGIRSGDVMSYGFTLE